MSAKMESRRCTPSVIANLMGLDELSPHQPVHKKQRVLSENYLRRVASVGVRGKRSSHEHHSFRLIAEEKKEFKDRFEVHGKLKGVEYCNLPVEKGKFHLSLSAAKEVGDARVVVDSKIGLFMKYLQEPDSLITDHLCNLQGIPNSCEWKNHQKPLFYHSDGSYVGREARKEILERLETSKKFQVVEAASGSSTPALMLAVPDQQSSSGNLDCRLGQHGRSCQNGLRSNLIMRPLESANRLQYRFRKQSHNQKKGSEYRNSGSSCTKSLSFPWLESTNGYLVQDDRVLQGELNRKLEEKDTCERTNLVIKSSVDGFASTSMIADMVSDAEYGVEGWSSENHKEKHSEKTDCKLLVEDGYFSSLFPYASTQQDMSIGIFKEDSGSSFCSSIDPESLVNSVEAYQSSPNSVLEPPFEKEILSSSVCFQENQGVDVNLEDLQLQLELLKSESSETYSEGDGMIVSSDDDFEQGSVSNAGKSEQFMRTISIEEGRDFSYLVDIFTEAGFHGRNSGASLETWQSSECPISPAVFEMLEKKYGEQISWKRSERRLLFDRINSELKEILQPSMRSHWTKPLSTRLCFGKSLDMIEEELWTLLDHQKKQRNKYSSAQMMGKDDGWLELGDDIEVIVREVEDSLIYQLAEEVIRMESF